MDKLKKQLCSIEDEIEKDGFWLDLDNSQKVMKERSRLTRLIEGFQKLEADRSDLEILWELSQDDPEMVKEFRSEYLEFQKQFESYELTTLLGEENDTCSAIISIHPGAGGTESQDWAEMLYRMYVRWSEKSDFKLRILDYQAGEEAGLKSVTAIIGGEYAYGYLKSEIGVHRLVRISPFDASNRRHTSFASVFVFPEIADDIEVNIDPKDLRVDTYRSSGAGGQHVNVTDSAVRITHIPTGIVVSCQNERSQLRNRQMAMTVLRARLYEAEKQKREAEKDQAAADKKEIAWGSQIRSYVLHPYRMAKDHRTGYETGNVDAVLDGGLDPLMQAFLKISAR